MSGTSVEPLGELTHVGLVVEDLEAAQQRITALYGTEWATPFVGNVTVSIDGVDQQVALKCCYSVDRPGFELIEEVPGTPYVRNGDSSVHHFGYYVADPDAVSASLSDNGAPLGWELYTSSGHRTLVCHRDPHGVCIELTDASHRPIIDTMRVAPTN